MSGDAGRLRSQFLYLNSLLAGSLALNQGDFAKTNGIGSGADWIIEVRKLAGIER
jgi:S-adenosylmethionine hydrolase